MRILRIFPWTEQELGIENYQGNEDGVYVTDDPGFRETYVHGNILLPGTADLEIKGTYSSASVLPLLRDVDFLYPITIAASADGMYFTDAKNTERLEAIFHENGYSVVSRSQPNNITLRNLIRKLMTNGTMYIAILCAMIGLIFSFIYGIMTLYRANARKLWIHHMFGLTKGRIALGIFLLAAGIAGVAAVLFRVVLVYASSYMGESDFRSIFRGTLMFYILLSAGVHGACYFGISRQFRLRGA